MYWEVGTEVKSLLGGVSFHCEKGKTRETILGEDTLAVIEEVERKDPVGLLKNMSSIIHALTLIYAKGGVERHLTTFPIKVNGESSIKSKGRI